MKTSRRRANGAILYRGPSLLTGAPIVVILTGLSRRSKNRKVPSLQTWILHESINPLDAIKLGVADSICGNCPHVGTSCYVNVAQAPLACWKAYHRGTYPLVAQNGAERADYLRALLAGRFVRLGSYGDPAAVPFGIWGQVVSSAAGHTGYTHAWRYCDQELRRLLMASADTPGQRTKALAMGWRTFRVRLDDSPVLPGEFVCPASDEAHHRLDCTQCKACDGATRSPHAATPTILLHGGQGMPAVRAWKEEMFRAAVAREEQPTRRVSLALTA